MLKQRFFALRAGLGIAISLCSCPVIHNPERTTVGAPVFDHPSGAYIAVFKLGMACPTEGAQIRYSLDGSDPIETSALYVSPVEVTSSVTVKARAYAQGMNASAIARSDYLVDIPILTVADPEFSLPLGTYTAKQTVSISCATPDAAIRYTTDGSDPTASSGDVYGGPVPVDTSRTIRAIAYRAGWADSRVTAAAYTITGTLSAPEFRPAAGFYVSAQSIAISCATPGVSIRYTADGSVPTSTTGTPYSVPVTVGASQTLHAIAYLDGWADSAVSSAAYTITGTVQAPTFDPAAGTYASARSVTISCATPGASIRYTTDGSAPTSTTGSQYAGPVTVDTSETLQAIASMDGWADSSVSSAAYVITGTIQSPTFEPAAGTYTSAQSVTISCGTSGASIRYTTDGSAPTSTTGSLYSMPVTVNASRTVRAIAYRSGWADSAVSSAAYVITGTMQSPSFEPAAGTYTSAQSVAISCATAGASIRYTTDGTAPTSTAGNLYSGPVTVSASQTVRAIAYQSGWADSSVSSAVYTITGTIQSPSFNPGAGTYTSVQGVVITSASAGASIRYTTDGTTPTSTTGTFYSGPVSVSASQTLRAIAYRSGWDDSSVSSAAYTITGKVQDPAFSPGAWTYTSAQSITISSATAGASIRYTTDGTTPTPTTGTLYAEPVAVSASQTLRAIAYMANWANSNVSSATYTITGTVQTPVFTPAAGSYVNAQSVTISCDTPGATIHYTTDGTTPSSSTGSWYTKPITVAVTETLRAIAFRSGWADSSVASAAYAIGVHVQPPKFSPEPGTYPSAQAVTISCDTPGATMRYTTDGSAPTSTSGSLYSEPITVSASQTLRAIAYQSGWVDSYVPSAVYTITGTVQAPGFNPAAGTYTSAQSVTISSATSGASIRYTTDGTTPTSTTGMLYSSPVAVGASLTLRAIAYRSGWADSSLSSAAYAITGRVAAPSCDPPGGTAYSTPQTVSLSTTTPGAAIRYTTDGTTPTSTTGTLYSGPITVDSPITLRAIAYLDSWLDSYETAQAYSFRVLSPAFDPPAAAYPSQRTVSISTATSGATIRYTTNGTSPSATSGTVYSDPIIVGTSQTLRAIAYRTGWTSSSVVSSAYTIQGGVIIDPGDGSTYHVTISNMTSQIPRGASLTVAAVPSQSASSFFWYVDGALIQSGASASFTFGSDLGIGPHTLTAEALSGAVRYSKTAEFTVVSVSSLPLAYDFESGVVPAVFAVGGGNWSVDASTGSGGSAHALRSAIVGNNATTSAVWKGRVPAGKRLRGLSYAYRVSAESTDYLSVYVNGTLYGSRAGGIIDWTTASIALDIPAGTEYEIRWEYATDFSGTAGSDCAWIDDVVLTIN